MGLKYDALSSGPDLGMEVFRSFHFIPQDSCITQLKAQGPSRTCNESKEEAFLERLKALDGLSQRFDFKNPLLLKLPEVPLLL